MSELLRDVKYFIVLNLYPIQMPAELILTGKKWQKHNEKNE